MNSSLPLRLTLVAVLLLALTATAPAQTPFRPVGATVQPWLYDANTGTEAFRIFNISKKGMTGLASIQARCVRMSNIHLENGG